jgi:hypothetical protein
MGEVGIIHFRSAPVYMKLWLTALLLLSSTGLVHAASSDGIHEIKNVEFIAINSDQSPALSADQ